MKLALVTAFLVCSLSLTANAKVDKVITGSESQENLASATDTDTLESDAASPNEKAGGHIQTIAPRTSPAGNPSLPPTRVKGGNKTR